MSYLSGIGWIGWDFFIGVGAAFIGLLHFWKLGTSNYTHVVNFYFKIGRFIAGIGWFTWGIRFIAEVVSGGDPKISMPGLLSITFMIAGTLLINLLGNTNARNA